jgi:hypothetical protein
MKLTGSTLFWMQLAVLLVSTGSALGQQPAAFEAGTNTWNIGGSYVLGIEKRADIGTLSIEADRFVLKNLSLGAEFTALGVSQDGPEGGGLSLAATFRHHLLAWDGGTAYIDGFFGPVETTTRVPAGGTMFNFISRLGPGASFKIDEASWLMIGARWWHLSNAQIVGARRNPTINGIQAYVAIAHSW